MEKMEKSSFENTENINTDQEGKKFESHQEGISGAEFFGFSRTLPSVEV